MLPVFREPRAVEIVLNRMFEAATSRCAVIDAVVGLDARGFLFGVLLALRFKCGFVPVRKAGKVRRQPAQLAYRSFMTHLDIHLHTWFFVFLFPNDFADVSFC